MNKPFRFILSYFRETDRTIWALCMTMSALSLILLLGILDAGYGGILNIGRRQLLIQGGAACLGVFCAAVISKIDYKLLVGLWKFYVPLTYLLMVLTFIIGVGAAERPDDKRWLVVPVVGTTFQPAELLRVTFILVFAYHIYLTHEDLNRPRTLLGLCVHGAVPVVLVHLQGDDGSALMILAIIVCMLFAAGISWRYVAAASAAALIVLPAMWLLILNEFQKQRILALLNQSSADIQGYYYQQHWAKIAFALGGTGGKGVFGVPHTYVPAMHNDFIFSFLGESLGFVGCVLTIAAMMALWCKILISAGKAKDIQGRMICIGVFAMLSFQSIVNIGMNISLMPVIGNTLPFLSYGGSSVLTSYLGVGLVLSVSMNSERSMFD